MKKSNKRFISAVVTSNKKFEEGTLTVAVKRQKRHHIYKKVMKMSKKYIVDHPSKLPVNIGDNVLITECAPRSKNKHFEVINDATAAEMKGANNVK